MSLQKTCPVSHENFIITDLDLAFYDAVSPVFEGKKQPIPPPTLSPIERQRRRLAFRNERKLYHRKCSATGKQIISNYSPDKPFPIYERKYWLSDAYNPSDFGVEFDFNQTFFDQWDIFARKVPRFHLQQLDPVENSDFCNDISNSKNCYFCFDSDFNENCLYCNTVGKCKSCVDMNIAAYCERCFECINTLQGYDLAYSEDCINCRSSMFMKNCIDCENCLMCVGMHHKSYHFQNEPISKKEFAKKKDEILANIEQVKSLFYKFKTGFPYKNYFGNNVESSSGNYLINCSEVKESFIMYECQDCSHCDNLMGAKNCHDVSAFGESITWNYECSVCGLGASNCLFGLSNISQSKNLLYSMICYGAQDCFGCISLKPGAKNIVLNKSYSQHEYQRLCNKIIDHMRSTREWGEFFPMNISPFGYNESIAQDYFPLSREETQTKGLQYSDYDNQNQYQGQVVAIKHISEYNESIVGYDKAKENSEALLGGICMCEVSHKPYRITKQELVFALESGYPLPKKSPHQRYLDRIHMLNPRKIRSTSCAKCKQNIDTTYTTNYPYIMCEKCYQKEVF